LLRELLVNRQVSGVEAAIVLCVHMVVHDLTSNFAVFIKKLIKILVAVISN